MLIQLIDYTKNKDIIANKDNIIEILNKYEINTYLRLIHFFSQVHHETNGFTRFCENLNYSAKRLMQVWKSRFKTIEFAKEYEYQPEKLSNYVYAGYHGRGWLQISLKRNYEYYSKILFNNMRLVNNPDLLLNHLYGCECSCIFWKENNINKFADDNDLFNVSRLINNQSAKTADKIVGYNARKIILDNYNKHFIEFANNT
jgi:putative chitinase